MEDSVWAESVGNSYKFTVATVWKLSFDNLDPHARFLLSVMSLLDPEKIPEALFLGSENDRSENFENRNEYATFDFLREG
jgi:hypothetical protein